MFILDSLNQFVYVTNVAKLHYGVTYSLPSRCRYLCENEIEDECGFLCLIIVRMRSCLPHVTQAGKLLSTARRQRNCEEKSFSTRFAKVSFVTHQLPPTNQKSLKSLLHQVCHPNSAFIAFVTRFFRVKTLKKQDK